MKDQIILWGAGRSSVALIQYLADFCKESAFFLKIIDQVEPVFTFDKAKAEFVKGEVSDGIFRNTIMQNAAICISLMPPALHYLVAETCIRSGVHLLTASYATKEMYALQEKAKLNDVMIMMESGLDPGIDHMSTMRALNELKRQGARVVSYNSFCGGLIAPESDSNDWHYKFTWNPMNVVLAGQGGVSVYKENGVTKLVPYHRLFERVWSLDLAGLPDMEVYPNRDSLGYQSIYGLENVDTFVRGTIRYSGFSEKWNILVQAGLTDHTRQIDCKGLTYKDWVISLLPNIESGSVAENFAAYVGLDEEPELLEAVEQLGIFSTKQIPLEKATSAEILLNLLLPIWKTAVTDKDMIVMVHFIDYVQDGQTKHLQSWMTMSGLVAESSAMAKTVGWPLGIAAKLILEKKLKPIPGIQLPIIPEIYEPILNELQTLGVFFIDNYY